MVELGDYVKDRVTGFEGVASGKVLYLAQCCSIQVTPKVAEDGKRGTAVWLDEPLLDVMPDHPRVEPIFPAVVQTSLPTRVSDQVRHDIRASQVPALMRSGGPHPEDRDTPT